VQVFRERMLNKRNFYDVLTERDFYEEVQSTIFFEGKICRSCWITALLQSRESNYLDWSEEDSQCTYKRNNEARSRDHCCRGKTTIFTLFESSSQALVILHAARMRHIAISGLSCSTTLSHIISQTARFSLKKATEHKMLFWFFLKISYRTQNVCFAFL